MFKLLLFRELSPNHYVRITKWHPYNTLTLGKSFQSKIIVYFELHIQLSVIKFLGEYMMVIKIRGEYMMVVYFGPLD